MKLPCLGFLTTLGQVGFDWSSTTTNFSFGCTGNGEEEGGRYSCEGKPAPCVLVASIGKRHTDSGCSLAGNIPHGNRRDKIILGMWHSRGEDGRVPEEKKIH